MNKVKFAECSAVRMFHFRNNQRIFIKLNTGSL
jgi:hypothetical protein